MDDEGVEEGAALKGENALGGIWAAGIGGEAVDGFGGDGEEATGLQVAGEKADVGGGWRADTKRGSGVRGSLCGIQAHGMGFHEKMQCACLFHQEQVTGLLDDFGEVALLAGGHSGDAARQDFAGIGDMTGELLDIVMRQFHGIFKCFLSGFLGSHKRRKEGRLKLVGKGKKDLFKNDLWWQLEKCMGWGLNLVEGWANFAANHSPLSTMELFKLPRAAQYAFYVLCGLTAYLIWDQHYWWKIRDEYAFGFIVPLFVAYIVYDRWGQIGGRLGVVTKQGGEGTLVPPAQEKKGGVEMALDGVALCMVLGGLASFLMGATYRAMEGQNLISSNALAFGFANLLLGGAFLYSEDRADGERNRLGTRISFALLFLFPALIWMLSVPMFSAVHKGISTFLMNKVAVVVYHTFDMLGFAVVQEGSVLKLPLGDVGVEDACSGIRSLTACLFAGSFLGAAFFTSLWKKVFLVGTAMLFAFINNIFRSLFLTAWAYAKGPEGLESHVVLLGMDFGNVHDVTGWVVLGLTVVCLLILVKIFSIQLEYEPEEMESQTA